ncbi:FtsW/RodA/SpoVE family cell cycle protein [Vagococcus coleopterorum]|uniref:Probable peptidoglycan glycosyltransferase FtsW n=1 Tax=Vagococcus coleopterorum TaxID=2714946 RepID=A0A6G8AN34_9ENTE|nr:FtsW/RodA/SpoVE family cell cycle protein [Vagococcus coleopterorum]QIL46335.1 FtsW/RodA/SpoVE family cell cycle protein [Vagococcus coleopterorum]
MGKKARKTAYLDYTILVPYIVLSIVGVIMSYSASSYRLMNSNPPQAPWADALKQIIFLIGSLIIIAIIYKFKTKVFQNRNFIVFGLIVVSLMLLATRFTPLGQEVNGARGWLKLGPLGMIQPAEFLKVMLIWYLSYILARRQDGISNNFKQAVMRPMMLVGALIGLVLIQPDTGGALILILITLVMLLSSGISYYYSLVVAGAGALVSLFVIQVLPAIPKSFYPSNFQHIYGRFQSFKNPFTDAFGDGHQMVNSYYAMYRGGWLGQGLGNSIQKKGFLPEAHSDFMFAIVLEELGLIVGIILLLLLLFLTLRVMAIGVNASTPFNSLMCIGVGGMLLIQTIVNVGGITGLIPLTGVTFPFLSQGGSSLVTLSIGIGFVLNIRADELKRRHMKEVHNQNQGELVQMKRI